MPTRNGNTDSPRSNFVSPSPSDRSTPLHAGARPYELRNPYVLAPMAGVSEMPFRVLAFKMGAALCPTELVSAQGLFRANSRTIRYLRHDPEIEKPYSLQIFGGEPEVMARAAQIGKEWGAQIMVIDRGSPWSRGTRT